MQLWPYFVLLLNIITNSLISNVCMHDLLFGVCVCMITISVFTPALPHASSPSPFHLPLSLPLFPLCSTLQVRWSNEKQHHTLASPYSLRLASVDSSSTCIVWDVGQATATCEFSLGHKTLVDMQWLDVSNT